jgi:hypothetical protein
MSGNRTTNKAVKLMIEFHKYEEGIMGLFDAFKKKEGSKLNTEVKRIFDKASDILFPNGETDVNTGTTMISRLSNNKLTNDEAKSLFLGTAFFILKDASKHKTIQDFRISETPVKEYIKKKIGGKLSETELDAIYHFMVKYFLDTLQRRAMNSNSQLSS